MFLLVFILFVCVCSLSVYSVSKVLEIEKDIDTLYNYYSNELYKVNKIRRAS